MDLMMIGSMGSYMKNMRLQAQWDLRRQSGDYTSHKASLKDWMQTKPTRAASAQEDEEQKGNDKRLKDIHAKLEAGLSLTMSERAYLKEKDPTAYSQLRAIETEQRNYEAALRRCRTKEEARRLKLTHLSTSLTVVNRVKNDPHISDAKKLEVIGNEKRKQDALDRSERAFVRSGAFGKLPTEAEEARAKKQAAEAEREKRGQTPETRPAEDKAATPEEQQKARRKRLRAEQLGPVGDGKPDGETEEQRKVRRARARAAAYMGLAAPLPEEKAAGSAVDVRA